MACVAQPHCRIIDRENEPRLVETTSLPIVYCDGIGKVTIESDVARVIYFEYRNFGDERVRLPVLEMIRPLSRMAFGTMKALFRQEILRAGGSWPH